MAKPYVPHEGPVVTHAEATAKGLKRYFSGSRCRRMGHLSERFVSSGNCIACASVTVEAYAKAHPEKVAKRQERYRQAHPEKGPAYRVANKGKIAQRNKAWKQANPEMVRANVRKWFAAHPGTTERWRKANPEAYRAQVQTRHALMVNAEGKHTAADLKLLMKAQKGRCVYCQTNIRAKYSVDHIQALSRGGSNWITNIQLLCLSCNASKQDADPLDFARRIGRLV